MTDGKLDRASALAMWERIARQLDAARACARKEDDEYIREDDPWEGFRHTEYCNVHDMLRWGLTIGDVCALYLSWGCELPREVTEHLQTLGITYKAR